MLLRSLNLLLVGCVLVATVGCVTHFSKVGEQTGDFKRDYFECGEEVGRSDYALELATGQRVELLFSPGRLTVLRIKCLKQRAWVLRATHAFVQDKTNTIQGDWTSWGKQYDIP